MHLDREVGVGDIEEDIVRAHNLNSPARRGCIWQADRLCAIVGGAREQGRGECRAAVGRKHDRYIWTVHRCLGGVDDIPCHCLLNPAHPGYRSIRRGDPKRAGTAGDRDTGRVVRDPTATAAVIACRQPELHRPVRGRQRFAEGGGVIQNIGKLRYGSHRVAGWRERAQDRAIAGVGVRRCGVSQIEFLPIVGQRVAVRIVCRAGQRERGAPGDGEIHPSIDSWGAVAGACERATAATGTGCGEGHDLVEACAVEIVVGVWLQVFATADSRVCHNRRPAARLVGGRTIAVGLATAAGGSVERVLCVELVPDLMRHIIDIEGVTDRARPTCHTLGLD